MGSSILLAVMVNYEKYAYTIGAVSSILMDEPNLDILVVDNGSSEANFEQLKLGLGNFGDKVRLIRLPFNVGYTRAINTAYAWFMNESYSWCLVMNNDGELIPGSINGISGIILELPLDCIICGKVVDFKTGKVEDVGQRRVGSGFLDFGPVQVKDEDSSNTAFLSAREMIDDTIWIISRGVIERVGYYSEYFFLYGEQTDFVLRANRMGVNTYYSPKFGLKHHGSVTTSNGNTRSKRVFFWSTQNTFKLAYLHLNKIRAYIYISVWLVKNILKKPGYALVILRAYLSFLHWSFSPYIDNGKNPYK